MVGDIVWQVKKVGRKNKYKATPTSHNKAVYASPPSGARGSVLLGQSLRSFPRKTSPTLPHRSVSGGATSYTAVALGDIIFKCVDFNKMNFFKNPSII